MNERIQQMIYSLNEKVGVHWTNEDKLKFALLIAQECAQLAMTEHHSTSPADYGDMEPYEQGCDDTASAISGKIRRIFGVEE